jgi:hypothetical protein
MNINIGDTVRFLREVGGGKVTGFRKGGLILVEGEDGFEIPMLESDLVVIPNEANKYNTTEKNGETASATNASMFGKQKPQSSCDNIPETLFDRDYNYTAKETLEERVVRLESMVRKLSRRLDEIEAANALRQHARAAIPPANVTLDKKLGKDEVVEIDLHAHALLDSTDGLSATEIKDYQMNVFRETMELYRRDKGRRIVFIHGNGDGVLRKAILTELKYTYKNCRHQDASFQQYGFGATMVTIG